MHLLYLDESGQQGGGHFVLSGLAVFERQTYWLAQEVDRLQAEYLPTTQEPVEFHASAIRAGRQAPWDSLHAERRRELLDKV